MKKLLFICCWLVSVSGFGQTPKAIEDDLSRSFKKINYWADYRSGHKDNDTEYQKANDSLYKANGDFGRKLNYYTGKYQFTIEQKFKSIAQKNNSLPSDQLRIITSDDALFRIYSWDERSDGSQYGFENVIQYKTDSKIASYLVADPVVNGEHLYVYYYDKMYTFKVGSKVYYLAIYNGLYTHIAFGQGIQVFSIEKGKLNDDVKLIKTQTGLHSQLYCEYNYSDGKENIYFDTASKTIHIPIVLEHDQVTHRFITYKFTGQYFEKVK